MNRIMNKLFGFGNRNVLKTNSAESASLDHMVEGKIIERHCKTWNRSGGPQICPLP